MRPVLPLRIVDAVIAAHNEFAGYGRSMRRPNILFLISDQERQRDWLPPEVVLPTRDRLRNAGIEFTNHHTHSSPCSPSRATLLTATYVPEHGVDHNVIAPSHTELSTTIPTLGHLLRGAGYRTSYLGKWHLSYDFSPDLETFGFSDWEGNDRAYMGWAGTGYEYDPPICDQAVAWLDEHGADPDPWCLTVALVNPHDVMWFPIDQPEYQAAHPDEVAATRQLLELVKWKDGDVLPAFPLPYDEIFDTLPANFSDDLSTKPEVHATWLERQQHTLYGTIDPSDKGAWLRHLDYYAALHRIGDANLARILEALDRSGATDDTVIVFTSDHGDMCGSHGLRSKGPFNYEEIMKIPLYVSAPGLTTPGSVSHALTSSVDVVTTLCAIAGVDDEAIGALSGADLTPVFGGADAVRDLVLFAQDMAWYDECIETRYASRGYFDGRYKYCRYYGIGGSTTMYGQRNPIPKRVDRDASFDEHEHELYDLVNDPHEMVNLAHDPGNTALVKMHFERLLEAEHLAWGAA
jgi:arylsulfatase A-like enzyme